MWKYFLLRSYSIIADMIFEGLAIAYVKALLYSITFKEGEFIKIPAAYFKL